MLIEKRPALCALALAIPIFGGTVLPSNAGAQSGLSTATSTGAAKGADRNADGQVSPREYYDEVTAFYASRPITAGTYRVHRKGKVAAIPGYGNRNVVERPVDDVMPWKLENDRYDRQILDLLFHEYIPNFTESFESLERRQAFRKWSSCRISSLVLNGGVISYKSTCGNGDKVEITGRYSARRFSIKTEMTRSSGPTRRISVTVTGNKIK